MYNDDDDTDETFWSLPDDEEIPDDYKVVVARLSSDLREASETLSETEARYLVKAYYSLQDERIRCGHRIRKLSEFGRPHVVISWLETQSQILEDQIRAALDRYSRTHRYALWARSIAGIGPVIAAGLIAHTHMDYLTTAGHLWSFAGLNPKRRWIGRAEAEKIVAGVMKEHNENPRMLSDEAIINIAGIINSRPELLFNLLTDKNGKISTSRNEVIHAVAKRPFNADLKKLCWKVGESMVKVQNNKNDVYGKIYKTQKAIYIKKNESGGFVDNAQLALQTKNWDHSTDAYKAYISGKLPPAHIHAMARRYCVKLFLAHYWEQAWCIDHPGQQPVAPYPIVHLGHAHVIPLPNRHLIAEAIAREAARKVREEERAKEEAAKKVQKEEQQAKEAGSDRATESVSTNTARPSQKAKSRKKNKVDEART